MTPLPKNGITLYNTSIQTPLGPMLAIADAQALHMLAFTDAPGLPRHLRRLNSRLGGIILKEVRPGDVAPLQRIFDELRAYFAGTLRNFTTPLRLQGSPFQTQAWDALRATAYGTTVSYLEQAQQCGHPKAFRAIANTNGANNFAIVIPCHRAIKSNGDLCGYNGGIERKKFLINHERRHAI